MQSPIMPRYSGFSLLELMVVILIIGIGAATVQLAVGRSDPLADEMDSATAFQNWFERQQTSSLLNHNEIGLYFLEDSVAVLSWREGDESLNEPEVIWDLADQVNYANDSDNLRVELTLDLDVQAWITLEEELPEYATDIVPHVIILPSEEYMPSFRLNFYDVDYSDEWIITEGDGFNPVGVVREAR